MQVQLEVFNTHHHPPPTSPVRPMCMVRPAIAHDRHTKCITVQHRTASPHKRPKSPPPGPIYRHTSNSRASTVTHKAPDPCPLCAWCVPPLHMIATPKDSARRAASTALPVPTSVRCTSCWDHGKPMRLISAADMLPVRQLQ
jgi:hypothetical protein